ncbi:BREX-2 system phosphatase PglZ [Corynebacterium variabile]|uniref:PglZ domain n=1 Tax=Corynebacterium variabile TaxID=1727 RepID=A0A0X2NKY1_9CORY|nr:BREX-2 system phosphatase PglZ [Corynebacterium variabile]CUU65390.1 PglZ domain [Corynebacterium variabile]
MSTRLQVRQRDIDEKIDYLVRKNYRDAVIVLHTDQAWTGPGEYEHPTGDRVAVTEACTPLALRFALTRIPRQDPAVPWNVVLTPLGDADLPADVRDRLHPYHDVQVVDPTRSLLSAFSATSVLPGVIAPADIPATLAFLDTAGGVIIPAPAGRLSADHLSAQVLVSGLGWASSGIEVSGQFGLADVLRWSATSDAAERWTRFLAEVPPAVQETALSWLGRALGAGSAAALRYLRRHGPVSMFAWGLACEVLSVDPTADAEEAAVRQNATIAFKVTTKTGTPTAGELTGWSTAAVSAAGQAPDSAVRTAEQLITAEDQLDAAALLHRSSVCPGGFAARIERLAVALEAATSGATASAYAALDYAKAHREASSTGGSGRNRDIAGAVATLRLRQFLGSAEDPAAVTGTGDGAGLAGWLHLQRTSRSWADLCVNAAWQGQTSSALQQVTRRMAEHARTRLGEGDRAFAAEASVAGASRALAGSALLVEDVLDRIVKPLLVTGKSVNPVLLLVLDGMSTAAANHLLGSVRSTYYGRWHEMATENEDLATALAIYPTVTTKSRASLLSGRPAVGGQDVENRGFAEWYAGATKGLSGAGTATLFHKGDLTGGAETDRTEETVTHAVEDVSGHPLVGAVLNTIDDALDKSDPLDRQWSVGDITHLHVLLQAAARAGRTVVLVSDHGHIVDRGVAGKSSRGGNSARWRHADVDVLERGQVVDGEVVVDGDRVLTDDHRAVLAVDEDLRYTARKAGYHGGLTLAEASIPVIVLSQEPAQLVARTAATLPLVELDDDLRHPDWWELRADFASVTSAAAGVPGASAPAPAKPEPQGTLFDTGVDVASPATTTTVFAGLESNDGFRQRVKEARVIRLDAAGVADVLRTIASHSNRMTKAEVAPLLGVSRIRQGGALTELKRIINVDGVAVFDLDGRDVTLNSELLIQQFGLKRGK